MTFTEGKPQYNIVKFNESNLYNPLVQVEIMSPCKSVQAATYTKSQLEHSRYLAEKCLC